MASTRVGNSRRDRFRDGGGNPFREGRPLRVGSEIVVRSIDGAGSTIRALRVATKLRLQDNATADAADPTDCRLAIGRPRYNQALTRFNG